MNLEGKVVVITGASAGLGAHFSKILVEKGCKVYGLARRGAILTEMSKELGSSFVGLECDVASESDVNLAFQSILDTERRIDVLINNAGLGIFGPAQDVTVEDWDLQMNVNLKGVFLCTRAVLPTMKAQNEVNGFGGHIVNISSVAGLLGNPNISTYNVTKFGLKGYSEALFKEVREDGIKVSCFYPGSIQTDFFKSAGLPMSANPMTSEQLGSTLLHVLETPDNYLITEIVMRPLRPKG